MTSGWGCAIRPILRKATLAGGLCKQGVAGSIPGPLHSLRSKLPFQSHTPKIRASYGACPPIRAWDTLASGVDILRLLVVYPAIQ
jgi:hypothetical protein